MDELNIVEKIKESIQILDNLDLYFEKLADLQRTVDLKLSDLYHCIENNQLKTNECYRVVKEIKKQRKLRRMYKNQYELLCEYRNKIQMFNNTDNRKFLLANLFKKEKLLNARYKNRIYSEEEIRIILNGRQ